MPQILVSTSSFDLQNNPAIQRLIAAGFEIRVNPYGRRLTEEEVGELLSDARIVGMIAGVEPITRKVIALASNLKVISRCGIGMDNVDLVAASERGIITTNTPGAPVSAVAEFTLSLMLNLLRRTSEADRNIRSGEWKQIMGNLLAYQTVGLVGFGRIGRRVAELVSAFGGQLLACDPKAVSVPNYVETCGFSELITRSDIVSLHLPYSESVHNLIGASQLAAMKPGAYIVNTARGCLVDEEALVGVLERGHLAGAALDVFEKEPYAGPLANNEHVLLTAHMGSYAKESRIQMEHEASENLWRELLAANLVKN